MKHLFILLCLAGCNHPNYDLEARKYCIDFCNEQGKDFLSTGDEIGAPIEGCNCKEREK